MGKGMATNVNTTGGFDFGLTGTISGSSRVNSGMRNVVVEGCECNE